MGCTPTSDESVQDDSGILPQPLGDLVSFGEFVQPGSIEGFAAAGGSTLAGTWEGSSWIWRTGQAAEILSLTEGPVTAAAETIEGLWVVMDGDLYLDAETLLPVPWSSELEGTVTRMTGVDDQLWLWTETGVYLRSDETLKAIVVDGAAPSGPVAPGSVFGDLTIFWAASGSGVFGMTVDTGEVVTGADLGAPVTSVAVDSSGKAWAVAGGGLWSESGGVWTLFSLEDQSAVGVWARPTGSGVWVETDLGWVFIGSQGAARVSGELPSSSAIDLDGWGRLIYVDTDGLWRVSADRPIEVSGLVPGAAVSQPTLVKLVPASPSTLDSLTVELRRGSEVLSLSVEDDEFTVDPLGLVFGQWTLSIQATHGDGASGTTKMPLLMAAAGGATWTDHIEPIYLEACSTCHGGAADTVLETRQDWIDHIDPILDNVTSGTMPLVGGPLEDGEIAMIQAWRAGDFAE